MFSSKLRVSAVNARTTDCIFTGSDTTPAAGALSTSSSRRRVLPATSASHQARRRSSHTPRPRPARYRRPAPDRQDPRRQTSTHVVAHASTPRAMVVTVFLGEQQRPVHRNVGRSFALPLLGRGSAAVRCAPRRLACRGDASGDPVAVWWCCSGFCRTTGTSRRAVPATSGSPRRRSACPAAQSARRAEAGRTERHLRPEVGANASQAVGRRGHVAAVLAGPDGERRRVITRCDRRAAPKRRAEAADCCPRRRRRRTTQTVPTRSGRRPTSPGEPAGGWRSRERFGRRPACRASARVW
jgi:hypothetical protein